MANIFSPALVLDWKKHLQEGLIEDGMALDWTGRLRSQASAVVIAKQEGVWAAEEGVSALRIVTEQMDSALELKAKLKNGDRVKKGQELLTLSGVAQTILGIERPFLNLAGFVCGIATEADRLVTLLKDSPFKNSPPDSAPRITPTRKTLPGYRDLSIHAAMIGGAHPHRSSLAGGILIKENHIRSAGGIGSAIQQARANAPHLLKIEIEVTNLEELKEAIDAGAEVIMLDNFSPEQVAIATAQKPKSGVTFEVSGGITSDNICSVAVPGIDVISVGALTHSVRALDLSLLFASLADRLKSGEFHPE